MVVDSFVKVYSSPFPPSKLWKASIIDANNPHPKVSPEIVASTLVVQGNGEVGTIRKLTFTPAVKECRFMKERIDVIDHEKHVFKHSIIEREDSTIRKHTFTPAVKEFQLIKERIDVIDHEKHVFKHSIIEREISTNRKHTFTPAVEESSIKKVRIDVIDPKKHVFKYSVIEGGLIGKKLKSCSFKLRFEATADGGCKVKVTAVYDTIGSKALTEADISAIKAGVRGLVKAANNYVHANPGAYA